MSRLWGFCPCDFFPVGSFCPGGFYPMGALIIHLSLVDNIKYLRALDGILA